MDTNQEIVRIRNLNSIVGYKKKENQGYFSYSKDQLWWNSDKISGEYEDRYSGYKDKNNLMLFENDIINLNRSKIDKNSFLICFDNEGLCYLESVNDHQSFQLFAGKMRLFNKSDLKFEGFRAD